MSRYQHLPRNISEALHRVEPSGDSSVTYYPCAVRLKSGDVKHCVYFAEATAWFAAWRVWPEDDKGKSAINVGDIIDVMDSDFRLPRRFAAELYAAGESGMGFIVFVVEFLDGSRVSFINGGAVDFIAYPPGQSAATIARVIPHAGREDAVSAPKYDWALFEGALS